VLGAITSAFTLLFCAVHLLVGRLRFLDQVPRSRWLSAAGGVAVAYVFMHILPELADHARVLEKATPLGPHLAETIAYASGLAGLALFYGIERLVNVSKKADEAARQRADRHLFALHVAANAMLAMALVYLLERDVNDDPVIMAIYGTAVTLHFLSADFGSHKHHPDLYHTAGRWVLVVATLIGWGAAMAVNLPQLWIGSLVAFVGGAIVLVTLKEELPAERESRLFPFVLGAGAYAGLIALQKAMV
jgi:zinc transporter ZupT